MRKLEYEIRKYGKGYRIYVGGGKYRKAAKITQAEAIVRQLKIAREKRGRELADLPATLVAELVLLHERCSDAGTSVSAAVTHWLPYHLAQTASVPLVDAVDRFLQANRAQGLASATIRERKYRLGVWVAAQPDLEMSVFAAAQVDLLRGFIGDEAERTTPASARNVWAVVSAFCTWAVHNDLLEANPCTRISKPEPGERTVVTMTPDEVIETLRLCVVHYDREVLSYVVLSLFAGLRPHEFVTEQRGGDWAYLDWKAIGGADLVKEKRLGKLKKARRVPVHATLKAWVDFIRDREGTLSGQVVKGYSFYQRFRRWKRAHYPAGLPPIENDILRHSYGTYRVLALGEVGKVALEMGNSEAMIRQHYLNGEHASSEADRFWELTPKVVLFNDSVDPST